MKRIMTILVAIGVMALLFGGVAIAAANVVKVPVSFTEIDPCTDQTLTVKGELTLVFRNGQDASGGNHFISNASFHGTAVGSNGTTYRVNSVDNFANNVTNGASESTLTDRERFISQDGSDNFVRNFLVHITFDSNGTPTPVIHIENKCVG